MWCDELAFFGGQEREQVFGSGCKPREAEEEEEEGKKKKKKKEGVLPPPLHSLYSTIASRRLVSSVHCVPKEEIGLAH